MNRAQNRLRALLAFTILIFGVVAVPLGNGTEESGATNVKVTVFWKSGCPYCVRAKTFLQETTKREGWLVVEYIDVTTVDGSNQFLATNRFFNIHPPGVPLTIIGASPIIGFDNDLTTGERMLTIAKQCRFNDCPSLNQLLSDEATNIGEPHFQEAEAPKTITLPFLGNVDLAAYSLPILTIVLAAIDGFNPCAMWVLVFLVSLLVGMQDRSRMWILGGVFLATSGVVYFGFLTAWLNLFLVLGAIMWVRVAVGCVALVSGSYYLIDFFRNKAAECQVTNPGQRVRIMNALKSSVNEPRFLLAVAGVVILAAAVNLIEFFCSAGIPAVYSQILASNDLSTGHYYSLIGLYVMVFILDDAAIFVLAMMTLAATGMTTRYLRISHLAGGVIMTAIGLMLIFAPDLLTFAE